MAAELTRQDISRWPLPNYIDPVTRGSGLLIINGLFLTCMTVVFVLRIYTRAVIKKRLGIDDFFIILAFVRSFIQTYRGEARIDIGRFLRSLYMSVRR